MHETSRNQIAPPMGTARHGKNTFIYLHNKNKIFNNYTIFKKIIAKKNYIFIKYNNYFSYLTQIFDVNSAYF